MSFELIDHTGDLGIVARAPTLEGLFAECAKAMFEILAEPAAPAPAGDDTFPVPGVDPARELRDFLAELLYRFSADYRFYVAFVPGKGEVLLSWEPYDPARHPLRTEIKAVTYHQLEVLREGERWRGQVIFDV
jgi:SHS2 domain-containing protein